MKGCLEYSANCLLILKNINVFDFPSWPICLAYQMLINQGQNLSTEQGFTWVVSCNSSKQCGHFFAVLHNYYAILQEQNVKLPSYPLCFMEELSYVPTKNFVAFVPVRFYFFHRCEISCFSSNEIHLHCF